MCNEPTIEIDIDLPADVAMALAEFVKRVGFNEIRVNAIDNAEAYRMLAAIERLQFALSQAGFSPR